MRFIIVGVGAVGGTLAAILTNAGHEVAGVARGRQLHAIRESGLTLRTPHGDSHARFECVDDPARLDLHADDVILLCVKSQDTEGAIAGLLAAGASSQPIFCMQNSVANERTALRHFANVYAVAVMLPCEYLTPGTVCAFGTPRSAIFDVGRYPSGTDATVDRVVEAFNRAGMVATVREDAMAYKYGKLLLNLRNVIEAAFADNDVRDAWLKKARDEAIAAYTAAGIEWHDVGWDEPRRLENMKLGDIPGVPRAGSSSTQSLLRDAGTIETDYLNGEIALLGRLTGVPAPVNAALCRIGRRLAAGSLQLGELADGAMEAEITAA